MTEYIYHVPFKIKWSTVGMDDMGRHTVEMKPEIKDWFVEQQIDYICIDKDSLIHLAFKKEEQAILFKFIWG